MENRNRITGWIPEQILGVLLEVNFMALPASISDEIAEEILKKSYNNLRSYVDRCRLIDLDLRTSP